jgi:hypothetical protein
MAAMDTSAFDGTRPDKKLLESCGIKPRTTLFSLIAMRQAQFIVLMGSIEENPDNNAKFRSLIDLFDAIVDDNPADGPVDLRKKLDAGFAGLWTPCHFGENCPFDLRVEYATRLIFHMHIPDWTFEAAMMKFKTEYEPCQFTELGWLKLDGTSQAPHTFSIIYADTVAKTYQFSLFVEARQGTASTRIIIDPDAGGTGVGP